MADSSRTAVVVEDDPDITQLISHSLEMQGFAVTSSASGREGLQLVIDTDPDLVTLDLGLPDLDGIEVCRRVREVSSAYVVMISARTDEIDRLMGLELGADDYLTKPFSPRELQARVNAMFRRPRSPAPVAAADADAGADAPVVAAEPVRAPAPEEGSVIRHGRLSVDPESRRVLVDDSPVELTRTEFELLTTMLSAPRRVWSRAILLQSLWGDGWASEEHLVEVHVGNLRRKLTRHAASPVSFIHTVRGVGYRMEEPEPLYS